MRLADVSWASLARRAYGNQEDATKRLLQREQKPVRQPIQHVRARIARSLDDALGACEDLFNEHGGDCDCELCGLVTNMAGSVRVFQMLLEIT